MHGLSEEELKLLEAGKADDKLLKRAAAEIRRKRDISMRILTLVDNMGHISKEDVHRIFDREAR